MQIAQKAREYANSFDFAIPAKYRSGNGVLKFLAAISADEKVSSFMFVAREPHGAWASVDSTSHYSVSEWADSLSAWDYCITEGSFVLNGQRIGIKSSSNMFAEIMIDEGIDEDTVKSFLEGNGQADANVSPASTVAFAAVATDEEMPEAQGDEVDFDDVLSAMTMSEPEPEPKIVPVSEESFFAEPAIEPVAIEPEADGAVVEPARIEVFNEEVDDDTVAVLSAIISGKSTPEPAVAAEPTEEPATEPAKLEKEITLADILGEPEQDVNESPVEDEIVETVEEPVEEDAAPAEKDDAIKEKIANVMNITAEEHDIFGIKQAKEADAAVPVEEAPVDEAPIEEKQRILDIPEIDPEEDAEIKLQRDIADDLLRQIETDEDDIEVEETKEDLFASLKEKATDVKEDVAEKLGDIAEQLKEDGKIDVENTKEVVEEAIKSVAGDTADAVADAVEEADEKASTRRKRRSSGKKSSWL